MTKKTETFINGSPPAADAEFYNIHKDEMNNVIAIDGSSVDATGLVNNQEAQSIKAYVSQAGILCTDSGSSANSYILTASSPFTNPPLKTGTRVRFKTANSNTGSSTITPFGGSAITCKKSDGSTDLTTGDISANTEVEFVYDGTNFVQSIGRTPATTTTQGIAFLSNPITISNNATDANNDIDFSAGNFQFSDGSGQAVATAMTKRLDATWSAGTGNGGLLNGTAVPKAINSTYHCYKIYNPTTGVEDSAFLLGIAGTVPDPTSVLPSGFTKFQDRGSILTDGSGNIRAFIQNEKLFSLATPLISQNLNILTNSRLPYSIDVPKGKKVLAQIYGAVNKNVSGSSQTYISDLATTDIDPTTLSGFYTMACNVNYNSNAEIFRTTNTSAQIGIRTNNNGGANSTQVIIMTLGWYDNLLKY